MEKDRYYTVLLYPRAQKDLDKLQEYYARKLSNNFDPYRMNYDLVDVRNCIDGFVSLGIKVNLSISRCNRGRIHVVLWFIMRYRINTSKTLNCMI